MTEATVHAPSAQAVQSAQAEAHVAIQAVVAIHGMGEQPPMATIKDFVRAVWENDTNITKKDVSDPVPPACLVWELHHAAPFAVVRWTNI
jgi:hypothetical protein